MNKPEAGFIRRLLLAAVNMFIPMQTFLVLLYFTARWLAWDDFFLVELVGFMLPWLLFPSLILLPLAFWRRKRLLVGLAVVPVAAFLLVYGRYYLPHPTVQAAGDTFTVMSYNVHFNNEDSAALLAQINSYDPDLLALHEYSPAIIAALDGPLSARYPFQWVRPGRGIYSRYPIDSQQWLATPGSYGGGAQQVAVDVDGRRLTLLSVHPSAPPIQAWYPPALPLAIPMRVDYTTHRGQMAVILAALEQIEGPMMLVGDLNVTDQHPLYRQLTQELGLRDAHSERGRGLGFTFNPFTRAPIAAWRIDYILHSPELGMVNLEIGTYAGSDHKPVVATISLPETAPSSLSYH